MKDEWGPVGRQRGLWFARESVPQNAWRAKLLLSHITGPHSGSAKLRLPAHSDTESVK